MDRIRSQQSEARHLKLRPVVVQRRTAARVAWLAAAAAVLIVASSLTTIAVMRARTPQVEVHLVLDAPSAQSVSVVGDWNGWDPAADRLSDTDGDGMWEVTVRVPRHGEYQYQFVVDDRTWMSDPSSAFDVEDGFGGTNSVLDI